MKSNTRLLHSVFVVTAAALFLCSCVGKKSENENQQTARLAAPKKKQRTVIEPSLLPQRFQKAGYIINDDEANAMLDSEASDEFQLKVGADITTHEPITLREAMKALIRNKKMGLSWASDVNQDLVVDIDVTAEDNFYEAIDNILRQLDYFHEVQGSTLIIKYRETKQYHLAMPFVKQNYSSNIGVSSLDSFTKLSSSDNTFDVWENIQNNINSLVATWSASIVSPETDIAKEEDEEKEGEEGEEGKKDIASVSRRVSSTDSTYTIDKPIGLITVHAPKSLQKRIGDYLAAFKKELYKQVVIEAKILEVRLNDSSSLGINWHQILDNLSFSSNSAASRTESYSKNKSDESSESYTTGNTGSNSSTQTSSSSRSRTTGSGYDQSISDSYNSTGTSTVDVDGNTTDSLDSTMTSIDNLLDSNSRNNTNSGNSTTTSNSSNTVSDFFSIGSTAATIISNGTSIGNTLGVGASLIASFSFPDFIKALDVQGNTSILSNPKISVMNGQPALISVGTNITYISKVTATVSEFGTSYSAATDQVHSGLGLSLTAIVNNDDEIIMNLVPITSEVNGEVEYRTFNGLQVGLPQVNMREMHTTVKIKDGSMLVVGGLISEVESTEGENFLPGTKDIPVLKYLFGYEEKKLIKRELIILLRPRIIN